MSLVALGASALFGVVVGVLSGLAGIGGGAVMVPFLYLLLAHPGFSGVEMAPDHQAVVAHATSLVVIVPTALSGLRTFHRAGLVSWGIVLPMAAGSVVAATAGAFLAGSLPAHVLKGAFGLVLLATGVRMAWPLRPSGREGTDRGRGDPGVRSPSRLLSVGCGVGVGLFSALMGVGGGLLAIPLLVYVVRLGLEKVAATSIGLIVFASVAGSLTYLVAGYGTPGLPPATVGYVFLPAALALAPGAVVGARWGARLNQRLDARALSWVFALLFLGLGLHLVVDNLVGGG